MAAAGRVRLNARRLGVCFAQRLAAAALLGVGSGLLVFTAAPARAAAVAAPVSIADDELPFITTPDHVTLAMLELAAVGPADHVIDLGSGDGRIVITAARRFGASGLGVEIVPELVARSRDAAQRAGVADRTDFRVQDLFETDLARATVVTMYLLPEFNLRLRPRLLALAPGTRIVSHDWDLGDWRPDRTQTLAVPDKAVGREKISLVHLWTVPARLHGTWCGAGGLQLQIDQRHQVVSAALDSGSDRRQFDGRVAGRELRLVGDARTAFSAVADGDGLRLLEASAGLPLHAGQRLARCAAAG